VAIATTVATDKRTAASDPEPCAGGPRTTEVCRQGVGGGAAGPPGRTASGPRTTEVCRQRWLPQ